MPIACVVFHVTAKMQYAELTELRAEDGACERCIANAKMPSCTGWT